MQRFLRKFTQLNGVRAKVVLDHFLFGRQVVLCEELQTINDNDKIGLVLKRQNIFMYKQDLKVAEVQNNRYVLSDGRLNIIINVNNL